MDKQKELDIYERQLQLILEDSKTAHGKDLVRLTATLPSLIDHIERLERKLGKE